jgi:hypothetical protein
MVTLGNVPPPPGPLFFLTPGSPSAHPDSGQGGLTLGREEGELDADFCQLGIRLYYSIKNLIFLSV